MIVHVVPSLYLSLSLLRVQCTSFYMVAYNVLQIGRSKLCVRMMWIVLDWNKRAIDFYEKIGASIEKEWLTVKMEFATLSKFACDDTTTM